jgi:GNAT superfamily N-acetyltransferase
MSDESLPEGYFISSDPSLLDLRVIHGFISQSYWAKGMPEALVARMIENSLCFGVYLGREQVGFARVISDLTTFAYVADVFVLPEHRGKGLSKALMARILAHPDLQGLRRWVLVTLDAHGLYAPLGFKPPAHPERYMEIHRPAIYQEVSSPS